MSDAAFYSVIMAGGASSRFWPFDGDANPKFLLKPDGEKSLLRHAYERAAALSERENILVVTGLKQAEIIRNELPEIEGANLLIEPSRRDTLAAAGWAMAEISRRDENAMALLTPADSFFEPQQEFAKAIQAASKENSFEAGRLYAIGVKPTRAETGFGYIEIESLNPALVQPALRFVEKPDAERAAEYVQSGRYLWNVGSFVWRVKDFLAEVKRQLPETYSALIEFAKLDPSAAAREEAFAAIHKTSVDYGVMEGASRIGVVALSLHFDDIGTWDALADRDAMKSARTIEIHSRGCHAQSRGQVAFVGVEDLVVVVEEGRVLVAKRGQGQAVKKVSETLKLEKEGASD